MSLYLYKYIYHYDVIHICLVVIIHNLNMPINVFGNYSNKSDNKIDNSLFVQKRYLRINYIESKIEEDINLKNQFRTKNLPDPSSIREACSKNYVDNLFNHSSIIMNTAHINLNDRNFTNARFIQNIQLSQIDSRLTAKLYVDNAIDESSLFRYNKDIDFGNYNLTNINIITLNKQAENDDEVITKAYVDQFCQGNERSRRDLVTDFYDELNDLVKNNQDNDPNDKKLTNLDSITVNRNPTSHNELSNEKYVDGEIDKNTIVRFDQFLQNYFKKSIENNRYNPSKYSKIQLTDTTIIQFSNVGGYLLQNWNIKCNDRNSIGRIQNFIR